MISSIYLENWKTHRNTALEFGKGTNVIAGKMGSGKSSVMDAISFALYGTFPNAFSKKASLEETIMAKPFRAEQSIVRMEFEYAGKKYVVERTLKRKGISDAKLTENGKTIAGPKTTDVTKKVSEILEVSYDLFSRAIYAEQDQLDFFLKLNPSQRKEKFDELLGLDKYEKVRANSVSLANRVKKVAEEMKGVLIEHGKKFRPEQLEEHKRKISEKEKEAGEKNALAKKCGEKIAEKEAAVKGLEMRWREKKLLEERLIKARSRIDALEGENAKLNEKMKTVEPEKLGSMKAAREKALNELEEKIRAKEKELRAAREKTSKAREKLAVHKNRLHSSAEALESVEKIGAKCPVCKRPFSAHEKSEVEKEFREEMRRINAEISGAEKSAAESAAAEEAESGRLSRLAEEKEKARKSLEETVKTLELAQDIEANEKLLKAGREEVEFTEKKIAATAFSEETLEKERSEFLELRERQARLKAEISSAKELLAELKESARLMAETAKQAEELGAKVKNYGEAAENLAVFTSALRATQAELRNSMIETINEAMDDIWGKLYPYGDFSSAKIAVDEGSYEIMARQRNNEWVRVEGILSGGERSTAALATRIAVSLVLTQNLGWMILDEPTHNLDANAVSELSEVLRNHLPELIEQVFVITHDKEMENAASGKLYVFERDKESDGVTKISGV